MKFPVIPSSSGRGERTRQRGLSMLEMCIAIVIAALVLLFVFQLIATGIRSQAQSRLSATLTSLSQRALEQTRLEIYDSGQAGSSLTDIPLPGKAFAQPYETFRYTVTYYQYQHLDFPQLHVLFLTSDSHPERTMYLVAVQVVVKGPLSLDGLVKMSGCKSMQVVTLMQYPGYHGNTPPTTNVMPSDLQPVGPPSIPIGMPARGVPPN